MGTFPEEGHIKLYRTWSSGNEGPNWPFGIKYIPMIDIQELVYCNFCYALQAQLLPYREEDDQVWMGKVFFSDAFQYREYGGNGGFVIGT